MIYFERQADGRFYHAGMSQPPIMTDYIMPGAIESPGRLEWVCLIQARAVAKLDGLSKKIFEFIDSLHIKDGDTDNDAAVKMLSMVSIPVLFAELVRHSAHGAEISNIALKMVESQVPL